MNIAQNLRPCPSSILARLNCLSFQAWLYGVGRHRLTLDVHRCDGPLSCYCKVGESNIVPLSRSSLYYLGQDIAWRSAIHLQLSPIISALPFAQS